MSTPNGSRRFDFAFDRAAVPLLAVLGVRRATCGVVVDDRGWHVRFGPWRVSTPWSNVADVCVTRDYHWLKAIGPRGSLADRGATFGTNARAGTCVRFHDPIPALVGRRMLHPGITVTVADPEALAQAVRDRIA